MHMINRKGKHLVRALNDTGYLHVLDSGDIAGTDGRVYGRIFGGHVQLYNERGDCPIYPVEEVLEAYFDNDEEETWPNPPETTLAIIHHLDHRTWAERRRGCMAINIREHFTGRRVRAVD